MSNLFERYRPDLPAKLSKPERRCKMCGYWKKADTLDANGWCRPCLSRERNVDEQQ